MWNSYISRDIITTIKSTYNNNNDWFYIRKNNSRMENESIYTALAYFQFRWIQANKPINFFPKDVDIYKTVNKINFRIKSKNEITKILEDSSQAVSFINSANDFGIWFYKKIKNISIKFRDNSL